MKTGLIIKLAIILPMVLFVDYLIMVFLGCTSCLLGFGHGYFCNVYCIIGKIILIVSAIFMGVLIYPDIKELVITSKHAKT